MLRTAIETVAPKAGLFDTLRSAYQIVWNRPYYNKLRAREAFFRRFIAPGDLVFDVGANQGDFAICYRRLGATVVCVEPNPALVTKLRYGFGAQYVIPCAVSNQPGEATLYLGADSNYSTIVPNWLGITAERGRLSNQSVSVPVTTLDAIIWQYGIPAFLKIDVEANELPVLRGLSSPIKALMFEYQCPRLDEVPLALDHLDVLGTYTYGVLREGSLHWGSRRALLTALNAVKAAGTESGGVYCRLMTRS